MTPTPPPDAVPSTPDAASSPPPPPLTAPGAAAPVVGGIGKPRSVFMVLVLTVVTFGIWTIVWSYQNGEELKRHTSTGLGGIAYLFITLLISPVTMFLMASEVEQMYRRKGMQPPITTIWGLWFLLPLIGNLIWYVRIQHALNDYWTSEGSTLQAGL
jgi:hypothetical protein